MEINFNQQCTVELTQRGADIANDFYSQNGVRQTRYAPGGMLKEPLWFLMQMFGPKVFMGMFETPFKDNKINIQPL